MEGKLLWVLQTDMDDSSKSIRKLFQAKSTMAQKSLHIYRSDECEKLFKISVFHVCLFSFIHTVKFFRGAQIYEKKT